ncbi:MAG: FAD-dependent oxidoreductase, partial [Thermodesulfobacteriota bacterium]
LGAREVTILYRRTRAEMPAYEEEVEEALEEGIRIEYLAAPVRFLAEGGKLAGVEAIRMELGEPDASGRRQPVPVEGSEYVLPVDGVLSAIGQAPTPCPWGRETRLEVDPRSRVRVDPVTLQTNAPWVFAGGDAVTGPATAVEAVAAGRRAAESIRRFLDGEDLAAGRDRPATVARVDPGEVRPAPRRRPPKKPAADRVRGFEEVVGGLDEEAAVAEASRCLACGVCSECYQCLEVCQAGAILHEAQPRDLELEVGAVILAPGFRPFDARLKPEYGYGRLANVITSLEFERLCSASGPFSGHVQRPSDGQEPGRVAWIQCVGSRDPAIGRDYCSYVCCMYATKQAIIGREHLPGLETAIFYMDVRAQGKGFDRYYERARREHGVRYVRSMISRIIEDPATKNLEVQYFNEQDELVLETFDLVVLSVGLSPHPEAAELARTVGVETDRFGFAARRGLDPLATSRAGVFACGVFQAPRDIPDTVMQASAAAAEAGALLAAARGAEVAAATFPEERDVSKDPPRLGVFVCDCGINIAGVVDVPAVVEYARSLPYVEHAEEYLFTCSTDAQKQMAGLIKEKNLNRVLVASCSPRTHEPLFQDTLRQAGLNPYLFEMANIRDQCSWVHADDHDSATGKAKDLVRMSAARAALLEPVHKFPVPVEQAALVIGGGPAGMTAALTLAGQGFRVHLVEREATLGGLSRRLARTLEGDDVRAFLFGLIEKVENHHLIEVHLEAEVVEITGRVGWFQGRLSERGRENLVGFGAVIVATGAAEYTPGEYGYGRDARVLTQLSLHEELFGDGDPLAGIESLVMIQCVGSRTEEHSYCSRICCGQAVANALRIKELRPETDVTILFRDIRTFSLKEVYYRRARDLGVRFIRFDPERPPSVTTGANELEVTVFDQILHEEIVLAADRLVLSAAVRPRPDARKLASALKLPLDADGFFMEAHLKLRPVDFVSAGYFLAGAAHGPKFLEECLAQAKAAASRAATVLARKELLAGGEVAVVDQDRCVCCLTCLRTCPYGVPRVDENHFAFIDPAACQGCGSCASACPRQAIQVRHHKDEQMIAKCTALFG